MNNDYNVKFLPNTELVKMNLLKKEIKFLPDYYTSNIKKKILLIINTVLFLLKNLMKIF